MAITNHERVGKALELLRDGLQPFVEREMKAQHAQLWSDQAKAAVSEVQAQPKLFGTADEPKWDARSPPVCRVESVASGLPKDPRPSGAHASK